MENTNKIIVVVLLLIGWSVYTSVKKHVRKTSIAKKLKLDPIILDVRTSAEYGGGHYEGALNIPVEKLEQNIKRVGKKDRPVIVYCASGSRSGRARAILKANGFADVTNAGAFANMP